MQHNEEIDGFRRRLVMMASALVVAVCALAPAHAQTSTAKPMRIGIIGAGKIGGAVGTQWAKAGHEILFSSRHPEQLQDLVAKAGPKAKAGTPEEAAKFGDVVFLAVPYGAIPEIGKSYGALLKGKVVLDACNPREQRDGAMANDAIAKGAGVATAEYLPGARIVRAFNAIGWNQIPNEAHRAGEKVGIPLVGDDAQALKIASQLVQDAGFDPVVVGGLERSKEFGMGSPVRGGMTAREIKQVLKLP